MHCKTNDIIYRFVFYSTTDRSFNSRAFIAVDEMHLWDSLYSIVAFFCLYKRRLNMLDKGLTNEEVKKLQEKYGKNELNSEKKKSLL